jgi:hypothetical protein
MLDLPSAVWAALPKLRVYRAKLRPKCGNIAQDY